MTELHPIPATGVQPSLAGCYFHDPLPTAFTTFLTALEQHAREPLESRLYAGVGHWQWNLHYRHRNHRVHWSIMLSNTLASWISPYTTAQRVRLHKLAKRLIEDRRWSEAAEGFLFQALAALPPVEFQFQHRIDGPEPEQKRWELAWHHQQYLLQVQRTSVAVPFGQS